MSLVEKLESLYLDFAERLSDLDHEFVEDLYYEAVDDKDIGPEQASRIEKIWSELGLGG